jgi:hypothetical protein
MSIQSVIKKIEKNDDNGILINILLELSMSGFSD